MCISQPVRHPLDQLDLVVESLAPAVRVAVPNGADNRLEPTRQRSRYALQRLLGALSGSLNAFQKRLSGGFFIFFIELLS